MDQPTAAVRGVEVPTLGLGTWRLRGDDCREAVATALELGYRHVDTAEYYDNERAVGEGIEGADVSREDVFLVTKVWRTNLRYDDAVAAARASVDRLGVDAVDLLLVHWPNDAVPIEETMRAFCDLRDEGVTRHVGVSNFSPAQLREAQRAASAPVIADQVEYHPYEERAALLDACLEDDVLLTAYSPLAKGRVAGDETLAAIGERHGATAAQVALRWLLQQEGVAAIPKAGSREHLEENLGALEFELTDDEMARVFEL